jgi:hypothetical protein
MKTVKEVAREILDPIDGTYAVWDERVAAIIRADRESVLRRVEKEFDHLNANADAEMPVKGFADSLMLETVKAVRKEAL